MGVGPYHISEPLITYYEVENKRANKGEDESYEQ